MKIIWKVFAKKYIELVKQENSSISSLVSLLINRLNDEKDLTWVWIDFFIEAFMRK